MTMKKNMKSQFLCNFVLYSLTTVITCSFICYPFWFPSMNYLFSVSLQNIFSILSNAKFLFVIGNIIVIILFKDSILAGPNSSPAIHIYDEYIAQSRRRRSYRPLVTPNYIRPNKKNHVEKMEMEGKAYSAEELKHDKKILPAEEDKIKCSSGIVKKEKREEEEESFILPTEELNRRVEAYIARVNRQRLLEAESLACMR